MKELDKIMNNIWGGYGTPEEDMKSILDWHNTQTLKIIGSEEIPLLMQPPRVLNIGLPEQQEKQHQDWDNYIRANARDLLRLEQRAKLSKGENDE